MYETFSSATPIRSMRPAHSGMTMTKQELQDLLDRHGTDGWRIARWFDDITDREGWMLFAPRPFVAELKDGLFGVILTNPGSPESREINFREPEILKQFD